MTEQQWYNEHGNKLTSPRRIQKDSPLNVQHGGDHYNTRGIQPIEYIIANELDFCQGNVVKYVTRYKEKNGLEDLAKAKHYIEFLMEDYKKDKDNKCNSK